MGLPPLKVSLGKKSKRKGTPQCEQPPSFFSPSKLALLLVFPRERSKILTLLCLALPEECVCGEGASRIPDVSRILFKAPQKKGPNVFQEQPMCTGGEDLSFWDLAFRISLSRAVPFIKRCRFSSTPYRGGIERPVKLRIRKRRHLARGRPGF